MNNEALFFTSTLKARDQAALRGLQRDHLSDDYKKVYDYVLEFIREYQRLPLYDTVHGQFPGLLSTTPYGGEDAKYYADRIRDNAMRVDLEDSLNEQVAKPLSEQRTQDALSGTRQVVTDISERYQVEGSNTKLDDISMQVGLRMQDYHLRKAAQGAVGLPTPWRTLTSATGGLQAGDATAILARPNVGKTWAMILWAVFLWQRRFRVLFVSMETPPSSRKPISRMHHMIGKMCFRCYSVMPDTREECPAADIPRQRLSVRFDALGSRLSAWRLYKGWLTPFEEERLAQYYAACATRNDGKWGDLRIVATPYIQNIGDLEMEILNYQPDVVFWDSAYLAASPVRGKNENRWAGLVRSFKLMLDRACIPGVVSWHFNRDVLETALSASMNCGALTDELQRVFDTLIGLFRPPELEEVGEAVFRGLKTRDGVRMGALKTHFELKDCIDFSEISSGDE